MPAFLSHSGEDKAIYSTLCLALDGANIKRWDQETMLPGEPLADQLLTAIGACEVCVFVATRRSIASPWCLAELGAFWGAGKKVLFFMADPDLTEAMLPPQFKGNLRLNDGPALVGALTRISEEYRPPQAAQNEFFPTSGEYGSEKEWAAFLDDTHHHFDVLGVALGTWRKTNRFRERVLAKAQAGCQVRFLFMHQDSELLKGLLYNEKTLGSVRHDIEESYAYYSDLASKHANISVKQMKVGIPHFYLTRSDSSAIITQYLSSSTWGSGPTWKCGANSPLFTVVTDEFEHIWANGT
jgi:hypothetical protein